MKYNSDLDYYQGWCLKNTDDVPPNAELRSRDSGQPINDHNIYVKKQIGQQPN